MGGPLLWGWAGGALMQVIPYSVGAHPAMDSTFSMLESGASVPSVVYVEGLVDWIYVESPQDIASYQHVRV
jgi:hypothetical protein